LSTSSPSNWNSLAIFLVVWHHLAMSVLPQLLLVLLLAQPSAAKRQTLISVAGQFGASASDGSGEGASSYFTGLFDPQSVAIDPFGNIFIAETRAYRIRKVNNVTGIMTTYAGTGIRGNSGDEYAATAAMIHNVNRMVCDPDGNLYFADEGNGGCVRKVSTAGIISTVASGFGSPLGLGIDSKGNLFVSNYGSGNPAVSKLFKISKSTGVVTDVAGGGDPNALGGGDDSNALGCTLSQPSTITVDAADNIIIADKNANRIRRIDAVTNIITTIAGNGQGGVGVDGILATSAAVGTPNSVSVDAAGNVYIATATGVRMVNASTGLISTVLGASDGGRYLQTDMGLNPQDPQWQMHFSDVKVVGNLIYVVSHLLNTVSVHFLDSLFTVPVPATCNYTVMGQRDLVGALLRRASVTSEAACQSLCCRTPSCQGYALTPLPAEADYASAHRHAAELWRRVSDQPWAWHTSCAVFTNVTHSLYSSSLQSGVLSTLL
jgi:sugar lactone lactonase YvrE